MVTPISLPTQQIFSPAKVNTPSNPSHRETAFVFNFNSPAISHDLTETNKIGGASNGVDGSFGPPGFGPSGDTYQKNTDPTKNLNSGNNPTQDAFTSALSQASQSPQLPAQPQFPAIPDPGNTQAAQQSFDPAAHLQWLQQQNQQPAQPLFGEAMPQAPVSAMPFPMPMPLKMPMQPAPMGQPSPFGIPQALGPTPPQLPAFPAPPGIGPMLPPATIPPQSPVQQTPAPQTAQPPMPSSFPMNQPTNPSATPSSMEQKPPVSTPGVQPAPAEQTPARPSSIYATDQNYSTTPISDLNTMIAQPRTPDEKLAAINEIATRQQGDRQTYELLKQEISTPMQGIPPETASAIRQAALIALGSLNGSPVNAQYAGNELYGMEGIDRILRDKNENPLIKASAVAALGYMNRAQDKTIQKLLKIAAKDNNPDVKNAVAQVQAGQMVGPASGPPKFQ